MPEGVELDSIAANETAKAMEDTLPEYLGGHLEKTHIDGGTLRHLIRTLEIKSFLDIGCSVGGMVRLAQELGLQAEGIEGDWTLANHWQGINIHLHDFYEGPCPDLQNRYDLAWCVEFLEHVPEQFASCYMDAFARCKYAVCTAAPPSAVNKHHFNLQTQQYWIDLFKHNGFEFDADQTEKVRRVSSMTKPFMQNTGMFFVNTRELDNE